MLKKFTFKITPKKAFSLIELSVVIVIIGLIIGGITSGKSLVRTSKVSAARSVTLSSQIATIPGMVLWTETSTKDAFLSSEIANNSQLTTWYNREPSGFLTKNNLTAAASANALYQEIGMNDLPTVNMNVAGNMKVASFAGSALTTATIVIVFKPTIAPTSTATIIADSGAAANSTFSIGIKDTKVTLDAGTPVETLIASNPASFVLNGQYILVVYFNGSTSRVFANTTSAVNNVTTEVGGAGATLNPGSNILNGLTIGANKSGSSGIAAEISEVIVYNRALKDTERQDVMSYLSKKYKITVTGI